MCAQQAFSQCKQELERKESKNRDKEKKKRKGKCVGGFAESYPVKSEAKDQNDKTKPPVKRLLWVRVTQMGIPEEFFWQGGREGG